MIKYFGHREVIGREETNLSNVIKGIEIGFEVLDTEGNPFTEETRYNLISRVNDYLKKGGSVFLCTPLPTDIKVVRKTPTILQCPFYEGQKVYLMDENKIKSGTIRYIRLGSPSFGNYERDNFKLGVREWNSPYKYDAVCTAVSNKSYAAIGMSEYTTILRPLKDIFASVEDLVKMLQTDYDNK